MRESDLYQPVKAYLQAQGYEVKGEVGDCDVTAIRGDEAPVVVELKLTLNLHLLMQAVDRLALTDKVYVGLPMGCKILTSKRKGVQKLLRMLGLGLIVIDISQAADNSAGATAALLDPQPYQPRQSATRKARLLAEFERRVGDPSKGGSDRRKGRMTAYRQRALRIAGYLQRHGRSKAATVATELNEAKARDILYRDVYGWFEGHGAGYYELSPNGNKEIGQWLTTLEQSRAAVPAAPPSGGKTAGRKR